LITAWNDAEDSALQGLSCDAQVLYLRGLRRYMDYRTGVVGIARRIDEACLRETIEFVPDRGSSARRRNDITRQFIRSRLDELRRVGLIADVASEPGRRGYVFRLVLADTDQSAQNMNNRRTTTKTADEQPLEQPLEQPHKSAIKQRDTRAEQPYEQPDEQQFHSETIGRGTTTHPVSGKDKRYPLLRSGVTACDEQPLEQPHNVEQKQQLAKQEQPDEQPRASRNGKPSKYTAAAIEAHRATWKSYADAYVARYGVDPVSNPKVRRNVADLVVRLGATEAPAVAGWYLTHNGADYVRVQHSVGMLLAHCEGLRTQWATGRRVTTASAKQVDQTQTNHNAATDALEILRRRHAHG